MAYGSEERYESSAPWPGGSERAYRAQQERKWPRLKAQRSGDPFLEEFGFLDADAVAETVSGVDSKAYREIWEAMNTVMSRSDWETGRYDPPSLEEVWRYLSPRTKTHLKSLNLGA